MARIRSTLPLPLLLAIASACAEGDGRISAGGGLSGVTWSGLTTATASTGEGGVTTDDPATAGTDAATTSSTGAGESTGTSAGATGATGADGESSGAGEGTSGDGAGDTDPKFDLGDDLPVPHPDPAGDHACDKVDLLFVIDDSASMGDEQASLVASFPGFVAEIQGELADAESLHIGVVTTDPYAFNEAACADVLGALVTRTGGDDSSDALCGPFASGGRYMSEADELAQRFACAGRVGTEGDGDEKPVDAALYALGPGLAAPGACNEGFARDDALLVLVLITDEEEEGSIGDPPQWFNTLVALRGGAEGNVVVLSLIGTAEPLCPDAYEVGHRLIEFTEMFTYGHVGRICAPSYQDFFHEAIAGIAEACDHFTPPS